MKRRILSLLLANVLVLGTVYLPAYAAQYPPAEYSDSGQASGETPAGSVFDDSLTDAGLQDGLSDAFSSDEFFSDEISSDEISSGEIPSGEISSGEADSVRESEANETLSDDSGEDASSSDRENISDIPSFTDEEKEKIKEAQTDQDLTPLVEEQLEEQEEILLGKPASADIRDCTDTEEYARTLCDINIEYPFDKDSQIVLDPKDKTVCNEDNEEVVGSDSIVLSALSKGDAKDAAAVLKENGYENVVVDEDTVKADDRYATARLYVMSESPVDTRGASSVISFGETHLIQYASPAEAAIASEMLADDPGVWDVMPDLVMHIDEGIDNTSLSSETETDELAEPEINESIDAAVLPPGTETDRSLRRRKNQTAQRL